MYHGRVMNFVGKMYSIYEQYGITAAQCRTQPIDILYVNVMMTDAISVKDADVELNFFRHSGISSYFAVAKGQGQRRSIGQRAIQYTPPFYCLVLATSGAMVRPTPAAVQNQ
jgi:hypothetical protein